MKSSSKKYTARSATSVIVANMIGTGVFGTLGYQLLDIQSGFVILMLWAVAGITALCGALSYAELGAAMPRGGGEYHFLSKIFHPVVGFVAGWVSTTIGFAAPVAAVAMLFASYFTSVFDNVNQQMLAVGLIVGLTAIHITNHKSSGGFHQIMTLFKLLLIVVFCGISFFMVEAPQDISFAPSLADMDIVFSGSFAVVLIYANYAYMGWNSATYLSSEIKNPSKNLPKVLLTGTLIVTVLYVLLNFIFLFVAPISELVGVEEVGFVAAKHVFGEQGAAIVSISLSIIFISSVSAMIMAGPRAFHAIGQDFPVFSILAKTNQNNIPVNAILLQSALSILFVLTSSFKEILIVAGFTLGISNFATVLGVLVLRKTQPKLKRPYKTWLYPFTPILYLCLMGWTIIYIIKDKPDQALKSLIVIVLGVIMYFISNAVSKRN